MAWIKNTFSIIAAVCAIFVSAWHGEVLGMDLRQNLVQALQNNPRVMASGADHSSALARKEETERRLWRPNVDFTAEGGRQQYSTESISSPWRNVERYALRGTQLLYDFDRSDQQVLETGSVAAQAQAVSAATQEGVLLEVLTAHWSAVRAQVVLDFARRSEKSVLNITRLENSQVDLGKGYESDALQAKVQLAAAEARRIRAEGGLDIANARLKVFFGPNATTLPFDQVAVPAPPRIPSSLEVAQELALNHNKQLQVGLHRSQALTRRLGFTELKESRPKFELIAEAGQRRNWDSAVDGALVNDQKVLVQMNWNFNTWGASGRAEEAVKQDLAASVQRESEAKALVEEQVAIAWRNLMVARQNKITLANQVRIAAKHFEMVTAERQLGRRTLLEILTSEVALINAMSDLVSTEADGHLAALNLLQATGTLDLDAIAIRSTADELPGSTVR